MKQKAFASIRGIKSVVFHDFSYICLEFLGNVGGDSVEIYQSPIYAII